MPDPHGGLPAQTSWAGRHLSLTDPALSSAGTVCPALKGTRTCGRPAQAPALEQVPCPMPALLAGTSGCRPYAGLAIFWGGSSGMVRDEA
jgi:hypothetical protein